jgi:hypothetical protein
VDYGDGREDFDMGADEEDLTAPEAAAADGPPPAPMSTSNVPSVQPSQPGKTTSQVAIDIVTTVTTWMKDHPYITVGGAWLVYSFLSRPKKLPWSLFSSES